MTEEPDRPGTNRNIHPPLVALAFIVFAYVLGRFIPLPFAVPPWLQYVGLFLTFVGFLFGIGSFLEFRKARTTLDPHGSTRQLVTSGIYRYTRNPIYLGFLFMVIGLPLNSGLYWGIVMAPFYVLTMNRLVIEREEVYLEKKFNDVFTAYAARVRRWL